MSLDSYYYNQQATKILQKMGSDVALTTVKDFIQAYEAVAMDVIKSGEAFRIKGVCKIATRLNYARTIRNIGTSAYSNTRARSVLTLEMSRTMRNKLNNSA